jgi:hypothetical protein
MNVLDVEFDDLPGGTAMKRTVMVLMVLAVIGSASAYAHHSQVAVYESESTQKIEGELVQVIIRSPHSWVHVMAKDDKGEMQRFAIEWGGAAQLGRQGVDAKTLKVGDKVKITGRPGRNALDHRLLMMFIERPSDGWSWGNKPGEVVD